MPIFKGIGARIRQRLRDLGYVKPNGDLRVADFSMDHRYVTSYMYDWIADRRSPVRGLERLARDLQTTQAWLCFGVSHVEVPASPCVIEPSVLTGRPRRSATPHSQRRGAKNRDSEA